MQQRTKLAFWWLCWMLWLPARADDGMWLPNLIKALNEQDMQERGLRLTAEDIYSVNRSSLKDAILQFGRGCSGAVVSPNGLLLTNYHCAFSYLQRHSTVDNNFIEKGFWARSLEEEIANPGLTVTFIIRIEDVTERVLESVSPDMGEEEREAKIKETSSRIAAEAVENTDYKASVEPFYYGNEFYLFVKQEFTDVRLVGAPPSSIGQFGGETDNWEWPRHTGDFALFRIYAGPENEPANFSQANVPYEPRYYLPVSLQGYKEGDFTMVMGFPGRSQQFLTSYALKQLTEKINPHRIALRGKRLEVMENVMQRNDTVRLKYAAKYAGIANYWKKWQGETRGLQRFDAVTRKQEMEAEFTLWAQADLQRRLPYGTLLPQFERDYAALDSLILAFEYMREAAFAPEIMVFARNFDPYIVDVRELDKKEDKKKGKARQDQAIERLKSTTANHFRNYSRAIDQATLAVCLEAYARDIPPAFHPPLFEKIKAQYGNNFRAFANEVFKESVCASPEKVARFIERPYKKQVQILQHDPAYQLSREFMLLYRQHILPNYVALNAQLELNTRRYVAGLREMFQDSLLAPDANSTLRIAYGTVEGYRPRNGVIYTYQTTLEGILEKGDPNVPEFTVPDTLAKLYREKDYGRYGVDGTMPVAFIASNHTVGGNSGSPVINADGHLIGLNFDRVWEGTMSDFTYDPEQCRNISVDVRYILFIIDKVAGATHLIDEMTVIE